MKPFGREKTVKGNIWKKDYHPHPKHLVMNWWEDMCDYLPRTTMKQKLKKEIDEDLIQR